MDVPKKFLVFVLAVVCTIGSAQLKKRVAVSRFDDRTGSGYAHLGEGVADMLSTALVKSGKFIVFDRQEIDRLMTEQQLGQSGAVTPESAPKVGQLIGVELFVVGSVTEFGTKESNFGGGVSSVFGGSVSTKKARAVVDVRLVNTTTGEIVAAESKEGEESTTGVGVSYEGIDFNNKDSWDDTDIGKATRLAVNGVIELITANMEKIAWSGKVLKVNADGTLLMKPGSEGGVKSGKTFFVFRKGEEIKDPDTGASLGAEETKVGRIQTLEDALKGKAFKCKVVEGAGLLVGDVIRETEK
jgi:curli biogenesis system outer membrane secretion channel CsgG